MEVSDEIKKLFNGNINVRLVTEEGAGGSQFVEPNKVSIEDDGSLTVEVEAWR